jgi:hypothetical protein
MILPRRGAMRPAEHEGERVIKRLSVVLLPLAAAACATAPMAPMAPFPPPSNNMVFIEAPYTPADYSWSAARGHNGIRGSSPAGHTCAGATVGLTPDGPYSRERILRLYGSAVRADRTVADIRAKTITNDNPDLARFVRRAKCDAAGRFAFDALPDGGYFLIAQVAGPVPLALMRHVNLRGGNVEPVALTMTAAPR